ncbi:MAG: patatin-like phospholipase family protein, partial [Gammaproteobacteria bacterium]|nr:patatin-like phospholipase family protein [Gammaproteobacteria bacterium]
MQALRFLAGPGAIADVNKNGFSANRIGAIAGASGGAKWLVLSQLDRVIIEKLLPELDAPVHLVGSSIGSWRFACYAQSDPLAALIRFEEGYLEQRYSERPDIDEITDRSREILGHVLGNTGAREIVGHPVLRTSVMTVRARLLAASERAPVLGAGLLVAATANVLSRRSLGAFFVRSLFYDQRDPPPFFDASGFPMERTRLTEDNLADAIRASGSIPLILRGVRNIPGAPRGVYRDGGVIDYHLDLPTSPDNRMTLYPHFFDYLKPGWFDKRLSWRQNRAANTDRTIVVCPSQEFVERLPNRKVP